MSAAVDRIRERAAEARAALADCAENAPWDADYCRRAVAENEALADLLEALDRCGSISSIDPIWDARDALEQAITGSGQ